MSSYTTEGKIAPKFWGAGECCAPRPHPKISAFLAKLTLSNYSTRQGSAKKELCAGGCRFEHNSFLGNPFHMAIMHYSDISVKHEGRKTIKLFVMSRKSNYFRPLRLLFICHLLRHSADEYKIHNAHHARGLLRPRL